MVKNAHLAFSEAFDVQLKDSRPLELVDGAFCCIAQPRKGRLPVTWPCQNIGNSRCPIVWADLVSVCHTSFEDRRSLGPGYEKACAKAMKLPQGQVEPLYCSPKQNARTLPSPDMDRHISVSVTSSALR